MKKMKTVPAQTFFANINARSTPGISPLESGIVKPEEIYLANESRFIEANFSEPLTIFAQDWKDPNKIEDTLEFYAPEVPTSERFEYAQFTNFEEFLLDANNEDVRALMADFKRVEVTAAKQLGKTLNKGLVMRVDWDQVKNEPNWQERRVGKLIRRLYRNELYRSLNILSLAAANTAKTWDGTTGKNPDADVRKLLITAATASGIRPNRIGYGDSAWDARTVTAEAQNTPAGYASALRTAETLASALMVDQVLVSKERYATSKTAKAELQGLLVLMFYALKGADTEDASNIKRFTSPTTNFGTTAGAQMGGGKFNVYVQQVSSKLIDITVEHHSNVILTSTLGLQKVTVTGPS